MKKIDKKQKELQPVQIKRAREGSGNNNLILENLTLAIAGKTLLEATNLKLVFGGKYGLVGRNGIGKTCFMNALARLKCPNIC